MNGAFWVGLAVAVPLSILANLLTPWFQHRIAQRSELRRREEAEVRARRLQRATELAADESAFTQLLLIALLRAALIGAIAGALSGAVFALAQGVTALEFDSYRFTSALYVFGQLIALMAALAILNVVRDALATAREVRTVRVDDEPPAM